MNILDCTLRDGGYYCEWNYTSELVQTYLKSMDKARVDYVELGLRTPKSDQFFGPFAYTTDEFISSLDYLPQHSKLGVMINSKDFFKHDCFQNDLFNLFFRPQVESQVSLVRIASHYYEVPYLNELITSLKKLGYKVGLNLMQSGSKSDSEIEKALNLINSYTPVDVLYFADSMGNMDQEKVVHIIQIFQKHWNGEIGIHTHDNMGNALKNSLTALENKVTWLDSTVLGMGRGAGNARTEYLLLELDKKFPGKFYPEEIFELALKEFSSLQSEYNWGPNLLYYLAAMHDIHPSYIQEMMSQNNEPHKLIEAVQKLKDTNAASYSPDKLDRAMRDKHVNSDGDWNPADELEEKTVLILAKGPKAKIHQKEIESFIKRKSPYVICLNTQTSFPEELINAYAACNPMRLLLEWESYKALNKPIITPVNSLPENVRNNFSNNLIYNYGLEIMENVLDIKDTKVTLPTLLVFPYVLSACVAGKAKNVYLAGFDGFAPGDPRQGEMESLLSKFEKCNNLPNIYAVTPSTYNIPQTSIYSPLI